MARQSQERKHPRSLFAPIGLISLLLLATLSLSCATVEARNIALVYDNSGSMAKESKWSFANYSIQTLSGLAGANDRLFVVTMSQPDQCRDFDPAQARQTAIKTMRAWPRPSPKTNTPYLAVRTAMERLRELGFQSGGSMEEQDQDWLIISTDGVFTDFDPKKPSERESLRKEALEFIESSRGRLRVAFLLIGNNTDKVISQMWRDLAPNQVEIFRADSSKSIAVEMSKIAALISGRDIGGPSFDKQGEKLRFTSAFPLKRITVFQQEPKAELLAGVISVNPPERQPITIDAVDLESPDRQLAGKITHIVGDRVMAAGEYTIEFKGNLKGRDVKVLLETAVDFKVLLRKPTGEQLKPTSQGTFELCEGEDIEIRVQFLKSGGSDLLPLDGATAKEIKVRALTGATVEPLVYDKAKNSFLAIHRLRKGQASLSIEANCPNYFHLRSNVLSLTGRECRVDLKTLLRKPGGGDLPASVSGGGYEVCLGEEVEILVQLLKPNSSDILPLDGAAAKETRVKAFLGAAVQELAYDKSAVFRGTHKVERTGREVISVEADRPGYLHSRSEGPAVVGIDCHQDVSYGVSGDKNIRVPYVYSDFPVATGQPLGLIVESVSGPTASGSRQAAVPTGPSSRHSYTLKASGIPRGITVRIKGRDLTQDNPAITLQDVGWGDTLPVEILRDKHYREAAPGELRLQISTDDPLIRWVSDQVDYTLIPTPRDLAIVPDRGHFSEPVNELDRTSPYTVHITDQGSPISPAESEEWSVKGETDRRINFQIEGYKKTAVFLIQPRCYGWSPCFTATGEIPLHLDGKGPFPLEKLSGTVPLTIVDVSWWLKCRAVVALVLLVLLILIWLAGILKKHRFSSKGGIQYERTFGGVKVPTYYDLPGSWFTRYLVPYYAERKQIVDVVFRAAATSTYIWIPKDQLRGGMKIGALPVVIPVTKDVKLARGNSLEIDIPGGTEEYTYL